MPVTNTTIQYPYILGPVNDFNDLRNEKVRQSPNQLIASLYRSTLGDGYGGFFVFDPQNTSDDDNLNTIKPNTIKTSDPGRWIRQFSESSGGGGGPPTGPAGGDLTGTYPDPTIQSFQGIPIALSTPTDGYVIKFDGTRWVPAHLATDSFTASHDLEGDNTAQTVIGIQGIPVAFGTPDDGYVLTYVADDNQWEPKPAATTGLPAATQFQDILISTDGATFSVHNPIVSPDGWLANEDGVLLLQGL